MKRRESIVALAALGVATFAARAQQAARIPRIGYLAGNLAIGQHFAAAFRQGLHDLGYVEGRNVVIEFRDAKGEAGAVVVWGGVLFIFERKRIADLAARNRLPASYAMSEFVDAGGLMSYAPNTADSFRRAAGYVDRILKGAKPADLPVEQTSKLELVINLKAAQGIGLALPPSLQQRADRVVE